MHSRRFAALLIGAWLAVSAFMDFVAIQNFRSVDRFLDEPSALAAEQIHSMGGKSEARIFLRHHIGEINRYLFEQWEYAQIVLGIVLLMVLIFGHGEASKAALSLTVLMLGIVAIGRFFLTPEITRLGRLLDYPNTPGANPALFWKMHGAYSGLELLKLALGIGVVGSLLIKTTDRKKFAREQARIARSHPRATV